MSDVKNVHTSDGNSYVVKDENARAMIAPIEASETASQAYAIGDLFVYNGLLYKATAAIAQDATITPGTNCTATTVGSEINGNAADLSSHESNGNIHVTAAQKEAWTGKQDALTFDSTPTAGSTNPATSGGIRSALESAGKEPYVYSFTASSWNSSTHTITIAAATHGITSNNLLFQFWHKVSGVYVFNTWGCIESWAEINASTHVITLHGPDEGYEGKVVLYG